MSQNQLFLLSPKWVGIWGARGKAGAAHTREGWWFTQKTVRLSETVPGSRQNPAADKSWEKMVGREPVKGLEFIQEPVTGPLEGFKQTWRFLSKDACEKGTLAPVYGVN